MVALKLIGATLIVLCLTVGCSTTTKGSFCQIESPIRLSAAAVAALSDAEVKTILAHNRTGAQLCGWRQ